MECGTTRNRALRKSARHPRIVTLTSASAARATPNYHVAGIAQAALGATLLYIAAELGPRGVLCNAAAFSLMTPMERAGRVGAQNASATRGYLKKRSLTRRALEPSHVTRAVAFFVSPLCENVTGEVLMVDGGYSRAYL